MPTRTLIANGRSVLLDVDHEYQVDLSATSSVPNRGKSR